MRSITTVAVLLFVVVNVHAQHDPGRDAVRQLTKEQLEVAREVVLKGPGKMNSPIDDAEKDFVLAMIACKQGDLDEAFKYAVQAVDKGLPVERLQAGPREVLAPLYSLDKYNEWLDKKQKHLLHGPLLGQVTGSSASFWVRTAKESDIQINVTLITEDGTTTPDLTGKSRTSDKMDYTTTVEVSGLKPETRYKYEVLVDGKKIGPSAEFRTFPEQGASSRFSIAFGGGAGYTPKNERMWVTIKKHQPDALLMLGDNVYIDDPFSTITDRYCYYRRHSQVDWRSLVASTSTYSIYDDHDFAGNDCTPGPAIEDPPWKRKVWEVFGQNWNNPGYGGSTKQPGCWYDFYIGDVHFIMLDGRYYRHRKKYRGSMLGKVQKQWLLDVLGSSKGTFKVLASPVPWCPGVKPGRNRNDTWDGYASERDEIFGLIDERKIEGVILMAADRHRSDLRKIKRDGYDLYEVMSSRLTNVHVHELVKGSSASELIMGYNRMCSFGLLEFDTKAEDPQVTYTIVNIDNEKIDSHTIKLSQLSFSEEGQKEQEARERIEE